MKILQSLFGTSAWIGPAMAVVFFTFGVPGHAVEWFDDFSDGNADGWLTSPGNFSVVDGNYVLTGVDNADEDEAMFAFIPQSLGNTSVRARMIVEGNNPNGDIGVIVRLDPQAGDAYVLTQDVNSDWVISVILSLESVDELQPEENVVPPSALTDIMLQLYVTGENENTQLDMWLWDPAEPMPLTPLFTVVDEFNTLINAGFAGVVYAEDQNDAEGVFRYVMAADTNFVENADFDSSGFVDGNDFLTWQTGMGSPGRRTAGDANFDRQVGPVDLLILQQQFGGPAPSSTSTIAAVPEPASAAMALLTILATGVVMRSPL